MLGQSDLDELLAQRDQINRHLRQIIDEQTEPWGIKVSVVEIKDVELPQTMQRAMAKQAEAEREKNSTIIFPLPIDLITAMLPNLVNRDGHAPVGDIPSAPVVRVE